MKLLITTLCGAIALSLAGCNTMEGAGKDVQAGGQKVENAAEHARAGLHSAYDKAAIAFREARAHCGSLPADQRAACRDKARTDYYASRTQARTSYRTEDDRVEQSYRSDFDKCYSSGDDERCYDETRNRYGG